MVSDLRKSAGMFGNSKIRQMKYAPAWDSFDTNA
jgi:hypothetical protein